MEVDVSRLVQTALDAKADYAALVDVARIKFVEEFRKACEQNVCRKYNTSWACPPAVGSFSELKARACQYRQGLLFQTVHQLASCFDWNGMMDAKKKHDQVFRTLLNNLKNKQNLTELLALGAGACAVCARCAYLDQLPCRFPNEAFASVEAYGIDVISLEKTAGIPYYNGKNTVSYVGLMLFNR